LKIAPGARLLFAGDSVTDCGRLRPVGEGPPPALGDGYVARIDAALAPLHPGRPVRVLNMGVSGDTVRDLAARWDRDVGALRPDWLCVMIGINDVWRHFDGVDPSAAVPPEEFARTYEGLIRRAPPRLARLVLMAPFYAQASRADPMRRRTDQYGAIVRALADAHGALFVDTQADVDRAIAPGDYRAVAADRVHPTAEGHAILARAFLREAGLTPERRP